MDPLIDEANHVDFITLLDAVFADLHNPCSISQKQHRAGPLLNRSSDPRAAAIRYIPWTDRSHEEARRVPHGYLARENAAECSICHR